ncbi:MAG: hypothetical protein IAE77_29365 [Prosthecobacter sp.]|jgi:hypothetical protein|uniref:hypothetical protein n=1 Tax=Prosthecobacter sp. TaxID=1965333 RepID=UPI0019E96CB4|nr:hypothetical protein [Prosthecobacter sp.]MBE2287602.1 hypothetical protein [Prosthecobacter sp.]
MATRPQEALSSREAALELLERSRMEISAEAGWLRAHATPKAALQHIVAHHPWVLLAGAFAIGLIPTLLLMRRQREKQHPHHPKPEPAPAQTLKSAIGGMIAGQIGRALVPLVVTPFVEKVLKQHLGHDHDTPHGS